MQKIAIVGSRGKMGGCVRALLERNYEIVDVEQGDDLNLATGCDLVIDFSTGSNSAKSAQLCAASKIPLIIGATGQTAGENELIFACAKQVAILKAGNFSSGIKKLKSAFGLFKNLKIDSVTILERHHASKKDNPSGTALELAKSCHEVLGIAANIVAIRGGKEVGSHEISLYFGDEVVKISHQAFSRNAFAKGVCEAVRFLLKSRPAKLYSFDDL